MNDLLELIRSRRSIRKYTDEQLDRESLEKILEAGLFAANAGGGQRAKIVAVHNRELSDKIGRMNFEKFNRGNLSGNYVSKEQPSIIDDASIRSGFYGAPTVCAIFGPKNFLYSIPDAFCCAENMILMAAELGISSCITARAEETFESEEGQALVSAWNIPENYIARCFVILGYCNGEYPKIKARKDDRVLIVD